MILYNQFGDFELEDAPMKKFWNAVMLISLIVLLVSAALGLVYEYLIFDKSVIPDALVNTVLVCSYINLAIFIISIFLTDQSKNAK